MPQSLETYTFGNSERFAIETMQAGDPILRGAEQVGRITIDPDAYSNALDDINDSFRVIEDVVTGKTFEIAVANADNTDDTVDAEISTFNSSISNNVGNAREFAIHAASHPNRRRLYVASPGNGGSSHLSRAERRYARKTGCLVDDYGRPTETMMALARALEREDLSISRFATDSAGGAYATSLMSALPEGQVTHAYLKSRPSIMEHPDRFKWAARFFVGENLEGKNYAEHTQDPWRSTEESKQDVRERLSAVYDVENQGVWTQLGALGGGGAAKIWADMETFSRAGAARDTAFAFKQQPDMKMTHHLPHGDRLYGADIDLGAAQYLAAARLMTKKLAQIELVTDGTGPSLEVTLMPGTHHDHSAYPTLRASMEARAFAK